MPTQSNLHQPVMVNEIAECFAAVPPGVIVDATFGLGGHAQAILRANPDVQILGIDQDADAISHAAKLVAQDSSLSGRLTIHKMRFDALGEVLQELSIKQISGALFDLGVSSPQLDVAERGFSYRNEGPLDMRMDQSNEFCAADVVNKYDQVELENLISRNSDERFARRIAKAIIANRPITSTTHLAEIIVAAIPAPARRTGGHPAKRTFQAIRIEVNHELEIIEQALNSAISASKVGSRVAVLTYHSGENRIAKRVFDQSTKDIGSTKIVSPYIHESQPSERYWRRVRVAKHPTQVEQDQNRRAKSAQLRVIEKTLEKVGA